MSTATHKTILGVRFTVGDGDFVVSEGLQGGLVVVPSAPVLVALERNRALRDAVMDADVVVVDSGLMVLLWRILKREKVIRVSGLEYLRRLLGGSGQGLSDSVFWIMPSARAYERLVLWAKKAERPVSTERYYVAPLYPDGKLSDHVLLDLVKRHRPAHIIVALGGGVQERLGYFLKHSLDYRPGIHCIGAALGFLTGDQVRIPKWADRFYLGWLVRSVSDPTRILPRYWRARRLVGLMWRHREKMPPLRDGTR